MRLDGSIHKHFMRGTAVPISFFLDSGHLEALPFLMPRCRHLHRNMPYVQSNMDD